MIGRPFKGLSAALAIYGFEDLRLFRPELQLKRHVLIPRSLIGGPAYPYWLRGEGGQGSAGLLTHALSNASALLSLRSCGDYRWEGRSGHYRNMIARRNLEAAGDRGTCPQRATTSFSSQHKRFDR